MPSTATPSHVRRALDEMSAERKALMNRLSDLDTLIAATQTYYGSAAGQASHGRPAARPVPRAPKSTVARKSSVAAARSKSSGPDSPLQAAVVGMMRSGGKAGWSAAALGDALVKSGVIGNAEAKRANEKVRKALNGLKRRGVVIAKHQGAGKFARAEWKLAK